MVQQTSGRLAPVLSLKKFSPAISVGKAIKFANRSTRIIMDRRDDLSKS